jgi:hypothetical protein
MRWWALAVVMAVLLGGCRAAGPEEPPPVVPGSEPAASETAEDARLAALRATDQFDEFAEHERAARADGARLAWENFAPIVDGERVEWGNKAELWDAIAPKIRDEALLLGPEYRQPLWDNTNAIPNGSAVAWNDQETEGRGNFVEFGVTAITESGPVQRYWGALISTDSAGHGTLLAEMPSVDLAESEFESEAQAQDALADRQWTWVVAQSQRGEG